MSTSKFPTIRPCFLYTVVTLVLAAGLTACPGEDPADTGVGAGSSGQSSGQSSGGSSGGSSGENLGKADAAQMTCSQYATQAGWADRLCEDDGNPNVCAGGGVKTSDCTRCCESCIYDDDCGGGMVCAWKGKGYCCRNPGPSSEDKACFSDQECTSGEVCAWNGEGFFCMAPSCDVAAGEEPDGSGETDGGQQADGGASEPPCEGQCGSGEYASGEHTACTCDPSDPCGWANDGYCDSKCAQFGETFDDGDDCGGGSTGGGSSDDGYDAVLGNKLASAAKSGSIGYSKGACYEYVWRALRNVLGYQIESLPIPSTSAYQFGEWVINNPATAEAKLHLRRIFTPASAAPRGSVIVWPRGVCGYSSSHGHIEIAQGDGTACSDFCGTIAGCTAQVFMPVK
jgi:hypothetical protein